MTRFLFSLLFLYIFVTGYKMFVTKDEMKSIQWFAIFIGGSLLGLGTIIALGMGGIIQ